MHCHWHCLYINAYTSSCDVARRSAGRWTQLQQFPAFDLDPVCVQFISSAWVNVRCLRALRFPLKNIPVCGLVKRVDKGLRVFRYKSVVLSKCRCRVRVQWTSWVYHWTSTYLVWLGHCINGMYADESCLLPSLKVPLGTTHLMAAEHAQWREYRHVALSCQPTVTCMTVKHSATGRTRKCQCVTEYSAAFLMRYFSNWPSLIFPAYV